MDKSFGTDRRSFLKRGALVAAPLAVAAPVATLAADDSRAKLARLEDQRAIEALHRRFLRHVNGSDAAPELFASPDAARLGDDVRSLAEDMHHDAELSFGNDGRSATTRCTCRVEREIAFTGDTTVEQMARFQGQGSHRHAERRVLATRFVKSQDGWRIAGAQFA